MSAIRVMVVLLALVLLGLGFVVAASGEGAPAPSAAELASGGPAESFGDGVHEVLAQVKAGTYRSEGAREVGWPLCSWKMHRGGDLVASGTVTGPAAIVVDPGYDHVESRGCLVWRWQR